MNDFNAGTDLGITHFRRLPLDHFARPAGTAEIGNRPGPAEVMEEALETALILNFGWATGLDLTFLCRGRWLQPRPDILAVEPTGRLHVFELKPDKGGRAAAKQLVGYMTDAVDLSTRVMKGKEGFDGRMKRWQTVAAYLAGYRAGVRSMSLSLKDLRRDIREDVRRFPEWERRFRNDLGRAMACIRHVHPSVRGDEVGTHLGLLREHAVGLSEHLAVRRRAVQVDPAMPPVGWLVAPRITKNAKDYLLSKAKRHGDFKTIELALEGVPGAWRLCRGDLDTIGPEHPDR